MTHNDTLKRLRFALKLNDTKVLAILASVGLDISPFLLTAMMKKDSDAEFKDCSSRTLAAFLDGLIISLRGAQEGRPPVLLGEEDELSNNEILRKIRIALKLNDTDIIAIMALVDFRVSKSELSALFRKADHRNYKTCGDQFLRNFLSGLVAQRRPETNTDS